MWAEIGAHAEDLPFMLKAEIERYKRKVENNKTAQGKLFFFLRIQII